MKVKLLRLVIGLCALATAAACSSSVGDDCVTSVDCDPNGERVCDLSQPGGYCTVEGCDDRSCPEDSVCIRSFPVRYLTKECDPDCEDSNCAEPKVRRNDCLPEELCLNTGLCARRAFERRYCAKTCGNNGDCRSGYECRLAGDRGSMALLSSPTGMARFCAPFVK